MRMAMSDWDIAQLYRQGKDKQQMITVLADMNSMHVNKMRRYLVNTLHFEDVPEPEPMEANGPKHQYELNMEMFFDLYNEGCDDKTISREMDICLCRVGRIRRRYGLKPNPAYRSFCKQQANQ